VAVVRQKSVGVGRRVQAIVSCQLCHFPGSHAAGLTRKMLREMLWWENVSGKQDVE